MPLPKPQSGESHDDFISRCHSELSEEFSDEAQRNAVCESIWSDEMKDANILAAIKGRTTGGSFGYGLTTADRYVAQVLKSAGVGCDALKDIDGEALLKEASELLTDCQPDMVIEEKASSRGAFGGILPRGVEAPPNTLMVFKHTLTSKREDRDGDILHPDGAVIDEKLPLLWQHMPPLLIGKGLKVTKQNKNIVQVVSALLDLNELTEDAAKLIEAEALRFSHGFRVLEFKERKADSENGPVGYEIMKFEVLEESLVSVPSNVDAEIELFASGKLASDLVQRHAKALFDARTKQAPGMDLDTETTADEAGEASEETKSTDAEALNARLEELNQRDRSFVEGMFEQFSKRIAELETAVKDNTPDETKAGRALSKANEAKLQGAAEDMEELAGMDIPRAAKALARDAGNAVKAVLAAVSKDDDDDKEVEPETKTVEPIDHFGEWVKTADEKELRKASENIGYLLQAYENEKKAHAVRNLTGTANQ